MDDVRKNGVKYQDVQNLHLDQKQAEGLLKSYGQQPVKPQEINQSDVWYQQDWCGNKGSDAEIRSELSAKGTITKARQELWKHEGNAQQKKDFELLDGLNTLAQTAASALPGPSAAGPVSEVGAATRTVTGDLKAMTTQATEQVDANGMGALTGPQAAAALKNPSLYPMFRGSAIDAQVREMVGNDPVLSKLLVGQPNKGVDFTNILTQQRYDMTTQKAFSAHVQQYGDLPTPLIHLDTTQK